ncbi:MAG TPA: isoleucine--tRNA ligase [Gemmatimonadaceae bacterium]|nr:isoleucine--tRNA ligase [Gemmatimonadaceae bacterium]
MTANASEQRYRVIASDAPAPELEEEMLERWRAEKLFDRVQNARKDGAPFVFFEGPPTANGRPGIHHVFARTVKDLICRHRAMRGRYVPRKAGWDTHGLPVEIEVERALGISGKQDIERIGVAEFNRLCRESVFKYRDEWEKLSERIAYWLDYENAYATYTHNYVESVWWALQQLWKRELLYRGHKILPYCTRCGTALSSHEVAQGYEDVEDPSVIVALELVDGLREDWKTRILVWTTTPWTLVSNAALAVHPELTYLEVRKRGQHTEGQPRESILFSENLAQSLLGADWEDRYERIGTITGERLATKRYKRPLDWLAYPDGAAHEIIVAEEFVAADEGTGVVHMSPAFGADDYAAGRRHGLAFLQPVDAQGNFPADMPVIGGMFFKAADPKIIDELRKRGVLWKAKTMVHSYPHCWRCGTPLLYYARTSWFVRTTALKEQMLARNAHVDWHPPEIGSGRFGEWLENNVDWAISRDRYWGTPLPVWVNDADPGEIEVIGSFAELENKTGGKRPADFDPHKPHIDTYTWPAASGKGTMRRVNEVIDAWFDSGSMPFAQWHFPFENASTVERQFPGDYIAEGVDQTRGWFYSLLAIATGLGPAMPNNGDGQAAPYRAVIVNDLVRDANGQKMSKSRGNAVDPWTVLSTHGADATRLFLVAASQVYLPRNFDEQAIRDLAGRFLVTLKNTYSGMFATYANFGWSPEDGAPPPADRPEIDRWVLSRLAGVEREANERLQVFDPTAAARAVMDFVSGDLSGWYVRQCRTRYYDTTADDNRAAFATLHESLVVVSRLLAPFCPFVSDFIHRELTGDSVHLAPYARDAGDAATRRDVALESAMAEIRELARLGRAAREDAGIKVKQPLSELICVAAVDPAAGETGTYIAGLTPILARELNVKRVTFATSADSLVSLVAKPNFKTLGKKFGKNTNEAAAAVRALTSTDLAALERGEVVHVTAGGVTHPVALDDVTIERRASGTYVVHQEGARFAAIDPTVTDALRDEGIARELVSRVQRFRKDLGFAVSDRVILQVAGHERVEAAARAFADWIAGEVLATQISVGPEGNGMPDAAVHTTDIDGMAVKITLTRNT